MPGDKNLKQEEPEFVPPEIGLVRFDDMEEFYRSIPPEGSLGILALGAVGLTAWRRKRMEAGFFPADPVPEPPRKGRKKGRKKGRDA